MATTINQAKAIRQLYQLVTVSSCSQSYRDGSQSLCDAKSRHLSRVNCQKSFSFRWSRGSDLRLLRLTMNGLPNRTFGERPRASRIVRVRRLDPDKLGPFAGKIRTDSWSGPSFLLKYRRYAGAAVPAPHNSGRCGIRAACLGNQLSGRRQIQGAIDEHQI